MLPSPLPLCTASTAGTHCCGVAAGACLLFVRARAGSSDGAGAVGARPRDSVGVARVGPRRLALLRLPTQRPARLPRTETIGGRYHDATLVLLHPSRRRACQSRPLD